MNTAARADLATQNGAHVVLVKLDAPVAAVEPEKQSTSSVDLKGHQTAQESCEDANIKTSRVTAVQLFEYEWPSDSGIHYMVQEHVESYLEVETGSFHILYSHTKPHAIRDSELEFLIESGIVTQGHIDSAATKELHALSSHDVLDIMIDDYIEKYEEYSTLLYEKARIAVTQKHLKYGINFVEEQNRMAHFLRNATHSTADYNAAVMRAKRDYRQAYLDLQTFCIHYPRKREKPLPYSGSAYPVSLVPGQYSDYYKSFTPTELRYMPLHTALYAPPKATFSHMTEPDDIGSDLSDLDADEDEDDGNDDDAESTSGKSARSDKDIVHIGTGAIPGAGAGSRRGSTASLPVVTVSCVQEPHADELCVFCKNIDLPENRPQAKVQCGVCKKIGHAVCFELPHVEMIPLVRKYAWQCMECKSCTKCSGTGDEEKMLFCDRCDRGYHTYCAGLTTLPSGDWNCPICAPGEQPQPTNTGRTVTGSTLAERLAARAKSFPDSLSKAATTNADKPMAPAIMHPVMVRLAPDNAEDPSDIPILPPKKLKTAS